MAEERGRAFCAMADLSAGRCADAREGVAAFLEKRLPEFPDPVSAGLPSVV